jgi:hypothetical protein
MKSERTNLRNSISMRDHATAEEVGDMLSRFTSPSSDSSIDDHLVKVTICILSDLLDDTLIACPVVKSNMLIKLDDIPFIHTI